jgi:hypothetical protein
MVKFLKKEKAEFDVGHNDFCEKFEKLEESYKILEGKFSSLTKICEQLQIQLTIEQSKVPPCKLLKFLVLLTLYVIIVISLRRTIG